MTMSYNFSLAPEYFTPIRPQKVERLFSPNCQNSPRVINDITYQVPTVPKNGLKQSETCIGGDISIGLDLPSTQLEKFPRQSTGLKKVPLDVGATINYANESVASDLLPVNQINDNIPQYKPFYQINDSQPIRAACFHPSGEVFVVGSNSKTLRICVYPSEEELKGFSSDDPLIEPEIAFKFMQIHRGSIYCAAFNGAGSLLATGSNDQTVHVIKYNSKKHSPTGNEYKLSMHTGTVRDLCFIDNNLNSSGGNNFNNSNEGRTSSSLLISAGAGDFGIHLTDCNTMKPVQVLRGHESAVMSLNCWNNSTTFVSGSLDGAIRLWDIRSKRCVSKISTKRPGDDSAENSPGGSPVGVVRVEQTGKLLVSGHKNGNCMLYDIRGGRMVQIFKAHEDEIRTLNFSPKSYYLLTAGYDRKVKLIDLQGDLTRTLPSVVVAEHNDKVVQTAWHPFEYSFVTTCADGSATLWTIPEMDNYCNKANL